MLNRRVNESQQLGPVLSQPVRTLLLADTPPYYPPTSRTFTTRSSLLDFPDWNFVPISYFAGGATFILNDINPYPTNVENRVSS